MKKDWLKNTTEVIKSGLKKSKEILEIPYIVCKEKIGTWDLFASTETSNKKIETSYDEKHYFIIPYPDLENPYTLYSMRYLPKGVPHINDLPKRRIFHLPHTSSNNLAIDLLKKQVESELKGSKSENENKGDLWINFADEIDKVDNKITNGFLVIGGIAAIFNPVLGLGIASKALIPGLGGFLAKKGFKNLGEKINENDLKKKLKEAEKQIIKEFKGTTTLKIVNPLLVELQHCLETNSFEHHPIIEFNLVNLGFGKEDSKLFTEITIKAILNRYDDIITGKEEKKYENLGPEDLQWLIFLKEFISS